MKEKLYIKAVDALRVISILAVVLIHSTTKTLESSHYDLVNFQFALFLNQAARFAVPMFFIISGFVLELNYHLNESYIHYFKKRASKILIPYLFWSIIYYFLIYTENRDSFIKAILTGNASYQLYFIPTLCIYYLIFPFVHKIYDFLANKFTMFALLILELRFMYADYFEKQFGFEDPVRILILSYFFFVVGIVAARNKDKIIFWVGRIKYFLIPLSLYLPYYIYKEGYYRYFKTYNIEAFYSQWRISVLIYTIVLAALLFYLLDKSKLQFKFIEKISRLSFFVFFVHVAVIEFVWKRAAGIQIDKFLFELIFFLAVSAVSFGIAFAAHKIPKLSKITG